MTVWQARLDGRRARPRRGAAGGQAPDELRRVPARGPGVTAPARRAAYRVVRRVFEEGAYADRAMVSAGAELDPRDRALAQRIAYGTVQRIRTIDHGIDVLGSRPASRARPARPGRAPDRGLRDRAGARPRRTPSSTRSSSSCATPVSRAPPGSRTRSHAGWSRASRPSSPRFHRARSPSRTPTGSIETWVRDWGEEEALALMRAQNEPAELVVRSAVPVGRADRRPRRLPARARKHRRARGGADLAEPRLAARRAHGRRPRRRADPGRLRGARAPRRRCCTVR